MSLLKQTWTDFNEDKALRLSAALAYYSGFSIAPLLVITIGIAGWVLGYEAVTGRLDEELRGYLGAKGAEAIQSMVQSAAKPTQGVVATVIGFVTLMLGASGVFAALKDALNTIWEVKVKPSVGWKSLVQERFLNFGMVLVIGFLLLVSLAMSTAIAGLNHMLESWIPIPAFIWAVVSMIISFGVVTTLFALIFKVLPDVKTEWRDVWIGAAITALLFEVGKTGLSWYLGRESTADAYGAAGSLVLVLLWVYYTSCILFFGAEFTQVWAKARGHWIAPVEHAQPVAAEDRQQEGLENGGSPSPVVGGETATAASAAAAAATTAGGYTPGGGRPASGYPLSPLPHKIMGPLLRYLEARGLLLSLEAKEALSQSLGLLIGAAVVCVATFAAWLLIVTALVGFLTNVLAWTWVSAVAVTGVVHLLLIAGICAWIWHSLKGMKWFAHTVEELKHDRQWLKGTTVNA